MTVMTLPATPWTNGQTTTDGRFYFDSSAGGVGAWRSTPLPVGGLPAGSIIQWSSNTAPANWLICDGSAVSRTTYSSLFAVIGTTYGTGDGSTTFNLPDLRGRVPVGKNGGTFGTLAGTGGAESVTLASNNLPQAAVVDANTAGNDTSFALKFNAGTAAYGAKPLSALGIATNAVNNLQPYLVVNYIIKATAGWTAGDSELATRVGALEAKNPGTTGQPLVSAAGIATSTTVNGNLSAPIYWDGATTITLPAGRFTQPPVVTVTMEMGSSVSWCSLTGTPSTTSFIVRGMRVGNYPSAQSIHWSAVQMTSSSGVG